MIENWQDAGFGLYVHWPFCQSKCPYCDFNSHVVTTIDQQLWADHYIREIERFGQMLPKRVLGSIFFGGGTPSLMQPETVAKIIEAASRAWNFTNNVEISLEANPSSVDTTRFSGFATSGVNRISLGVQALKDPDLRRLGRLHSVDEARRAIDTAMAQFDRVSFDLIYARQGQSLSEWAAELKTALTLGADHMSLYQLTIEPGTVFGARYERGQLRDLPADDVATDMYFETQNIMEDAGFEGYEISNHARPGEVCRHNLVYWRRGDWAAIGPGAHGRLQIDGTALATEAARQPQEWMNLVENRGNGDSLVETLPADEVATEYLLMSLRLSEGMDLRRYASMGGRLDWEKVDDLVQSGHLSNTQERLIATKLGRPILNHILGQIAA